MATIDRLDIQITAEAKKSNRAVENLSKKLDILAKSLMSVDTGKLTGISTGIRNIADAATGFKGEKSKELSSLANALKKFGNIDTSSLYGISSAIKNLAEGIYAAHGVDTSGIANIISEISKLGSVKSTTGTENLLKIKDDLLNFVEGMNRIGSLTFDVASLSALLESISRIGSKASTGAAANLSPISAQLQNLIRQLNNIGSLTFDTTNLSNLINAIYRLGGKSVTNAITNIPQLAVAMRNLMQTLSTAPVVSQNVIQMTNALANLASQGGKVGTASRTMVSGLNNTSNAMNRAKKSSLSLAAAFGKFYATWFLVIRGIKGFMKSVESTTDYIEAYNYYNVAFGKIASEWDKDFEKYGYQNAESYAESFTKRMNETLGKLSGVQVNLETGLLEETGLRNLGLNIQEITQYASQLASVTNSIGQTGEVSLAAAKSMTMLAGDISSLFNIDYGSVAQNLQSGLIGQSRALYKYGIDITNATLQTYAYNLGLEKSVSEMTQAEKMQLRMLAILEQSKVSWGDLANTISSPSNMLRQFTNNVKELGMVFGQLFIPVLQKVMPIINGVTIALKRILVAFANILGIKIDFDAFGQGYSDLGDDADDLADSIEGIGKAAKKANAGLRAFDELKVINLPDTSTGGVAGGDMIDLTQQILDATSEYEKVWNEAFAKMENTAQEWADKIGKHIEPIKKIFENFAIGDFFQAGKDVSGLVTGITNFFTSALKKVNWNKIGTDMGDYFAGIKWGTVLKSTGKLIWTALKSVLGTWSGSFDAAPIETGIITAIGILKFTALGDVLKGKINGALSKASKNLNLTSLGGAIAAYFGEFTLIEDGFSGLIDGSKKLYTALTEIATGVGIAILALESLGLLNPYTALLAGATLVAGAIIGISKGHKELEKELKESKEIELYGATLDNIRQNMEKVVEKSKEWREDTENYVNNAGIAEEKFLEDLAGKYFDLAEKEGKTNEETEEMKRLAGLLVEKAPELEKYYNDQTGLIDANRKAVEKLIQEKIKEIKLNAIGSKLGESYAQLVELEVKLADVKEVADIAQDEFWKKVEEKKELENLKQRTEALFKLKGAYGNLKVPVEEYKKEEAEIKELYEKLGIKFSYDPRLKELRAAIQEKQKVLDDWSRTEVRVAQEAYNAMSEEYEKTKKLQEKYLKMYTSGNIEAFDEVSKTAKTGTSNFTNQIKSGISKAELAIKGLKEAAVGAINDLPDKMEEIGKNSTDGFEEGLKAKKSILLDAAKGIASAVKGAFEKTFQIHSPSKVMFELGGYVMQGFQNGLEDIYKPILSSVKAFSYDLEVAPAPSFDKVYGGYNYYADVNAAQSGVRNYDASGMIGKEVYDAVSSAIRNNMGTGSSSPEIRVYIGYREITDVVIEGITERANRTQKMPFPVYL